MEQLRQLWEQQRWRMVTGIVGVVMVGVGVWQMVVVSRGNEAVVETPETSDQKPENLGEVVVDVGGAVAKPGLYRLSVGIRVGEVLEQAGGITDEADSEWVGKMMNLAEVTRDGQKIYVPVKGDAGINNQSSMINNQQRGVAGATIVNVNAATVEELDSLWGIGAARSQAIVDNRPYGSLEELKVKAGIPENVIEANEGKWGVY